MDDAAGTPLLGGSTGGPPARRGHHLMGLTLAGLLGASLSALALLAHGSGCGRGGAPSWPGPPPRASPAYLSLLDAAGPLLPPTVHAVLGGDSLTPGTVLIVGDVHGCTSELAALLGRARLQPSDTLILAGDLVAKGPDSAGVLDLLLKNGTAAVARPRTYAVRGNHDDVALAAVEAWAARRVPPPPDLAWVRALSPAHAAALAALPFSLSLPSLGLAVVHAGAVPGVALGAQRLGDLYTMRGIRPAGTSGSGSGSGWEAVEVCERVGGGGGRLPGRRHGPPGGAPASPNETCARSAEGAVPWAPHWSGPPHLVFGHDRERGLQLAPGATGLETGAAYGGWLTGLAVCVPSSSSLSSSSSSSDGEPDSSCFSASGPDLGVSGDGVSGAVAVPGLGGRARLVWVRAARNYTAAAA
jgi:bis(5'-nucleosyl)-tetraphosphatase (symmetrical)